MFSQKWRVSKVADTNITIRWARYAVTSKTNGYIVLRLSIEDMKGPKR